MGQKRYNVYKHYGVYYRTRDDWVWVYMADAWRVSLLYPRDVHRSAALVGTNVVFK